MINRIKIKKGLTLIELLVTIGISSFLILIIGAIFSNGYKSYQVGNRKIEANEIAVNAVSDFEKTARNTIEVGAVTPNSVTLHAFLRGETVSLNPSEIIYRYDSSNGKFFRSTAEPILDGGGNVIGYGTPVEKELASFVRSAIFTYYNAGNQLLSAPVQRDVVKMINLEVHVDKDPANPPDEAAQATSIQLRSLKSNL